MSVSTGYQALREGAGMAPQRRDVVVAEGPDVITYLQGQLSQDVSQLAVGSGTYSFVLQPHGKVDAFVHLGRVADETVILTVDEGHGAALVERLERFKLRTQVTITQPEWKVLAVRGPKAASVDVIDGTVVESPWRAGGGFDVVGPDPKVEGAEPVDAEAFEAYRIECGVPSMGRELDERTIPAEAAVNDMAISFNKGCYTGQELVARIDARGGNVPRLLRGLVLETDEVPPVGSKVMPVANVTATTKPLGFITSAAYSAGYGAVVALAYIRRDALMAATGSVDWDHGPTTCRIEALPLTPS